MDDEGEAIRAVIARAFGYLAASAIAKDRKDLLDTAEEGAFWILTGRLLSNPEADELTDNWMHRKPGGKP